MGIFRILPLLVLLLAGCGKVIPPTIPGPHDRSEPLDAPDRLLVDMGIMDARFQPIVGFEHVLVSPALHWRIDEYAEHKGLAQKKDFIEKFLREANTLNNAVMQAAVQKVPAEALPRYLDDFLREHPEVATVAGAGSIAERFLSAYLKHSTDEMDEELGVLRKMEGEAAVDDYWQALTGHIAESIKTKGRVERLVGSAPLVPVIYAWIWYHAETDDRSAHVPHFAQSSVFYPDKARAKVNPATLKRDWDLLEYYSPTVVQEVKDNTPYPSASDRFGEVFLSGQTLEEATPGVHGDRPTLYAYSQWKTIQGSKTRQLVYTLWYPEHPKQKSFDPEAGLMEGWTLRLTLNHHNQPLMYESVSNCGCYYKVFPTDRLEALSKEHFPERVKDKLFHLEKNVTARIDAVVPELVPVDPPGPVTLYYSAGHHQLVTIRPPGPLAVGSVRTPMERYRLRPYEELENLPFNQIKASLFGPDGLVRKADRPECQLLTPSGLYHAGHPRQRDTQMIYFDQADLEDPDLFEKYLRLPPAAFTRAIR